MSGCTIGISNLYYSDVQFVITNGVGALLKEYGPIHKFYPVTMYGYYLASLIVGVYAIRKKKSVHNRYIESIIFFSGMAGMCYILQRVVIFMYEIMPASYLILMLGTLYPLYKSNLFTVHENRDLSTGGHVKRTTEVVKIFCRRLLDSDLKLDADFLNLVIRSASMHDLGKIGVDDSILRKQGKFTDEEYEKMKAHSKIGARMVNFLMTKHFL